MYILLAVILFGILIITHELGHFVTAKLCGVRVLEFSVGMGPTLLKKQWGETRYSLRCLPLGGFCAMDGEDEASDDPRAFSNQGVGKRLIILAAGAAMNLVFGFLLVLILFAKAPVFSVPVITDFFDGCPYQAADGFQTGDEIVSVNGHRILFTSDFPTYVQRDGDGLVDIVLRRDGHRVVLRDYPLALREYTIDGETGQYYGFRFGNTVSGFFPLLKYAWYQTLDFVRVVWMGLEDLVSGAVGLRQLSGVVGIVATMNDVAREADEISAGAGLYSLVYLSAFIAVNLAVMNLLPIPALDGGRILFLLLTWVIEKLIRRSVDPKYEGYIHGAGLVLLLGLMALVMVNDIAKLIVK